MPRVGYPDPITFHDAYAKLAAFHDELWDRTGIAPEATLFGGFSMGSAAVRWLAATAAEDLSAATTTPEQKER